MEDTQNNQPVPQVQQQEPSQPQIESPLPEISNAIFDFLKTNMIKIIGVFLILLALILGGIFVMSGGNFTQSGVVVSLNGPDQISSGEIINYEVKYSNNTEQLIEKAVLSIFLPNDVYVIATDSYEETNIIKIPLGDVEAGYSNIYNLRLILVGQTDSLKLIKANLEYSPRGVDTRLTNEAQINARVVSAPLDIVVERPQNISPNQNIKYVIKYNNTKDDVIEGARLSLKMPEGFTLQDATPDLISGKYINIERILPGEEGEILLTGQMRGATGQAKSLRVGVELPLLLGDSASYKEVQYVEDVVELAKPPLSFSATINGNDNYIASLGDNLSYDIKITNDTQVAFNNLILSIEFAGNMFDTSKLDANGQIRSGGRIVYYDVTNLSELGILESGESIVVPVKIGVAKAFPLFTQATDDDLLLRVRLESDAVPVGLSADVLPFSVEKRSKIAIGATFDAKVFKQYSDFVGLGDFPPKVGQESQFVISLKSLSPTTSLRNMVMTAKLGSGVKWLDRTRVVAPVINPINYDSRLNTITWRIGDVPMGSGGSDITKNIEAILMLAVTPSENQLDSEPVLLQDMVFEGTDVLKNQPYRFNVRSVTTRKVEDRAGSGRVVE